MQESSIRALLDRIARCVLHGLPRDPGRGNTDLRHVERRRRPDSPWSDGIPISDGWMDLVEDRARGRALAAPTLEMKLAVGGTRLEWSRIEGAAEYVLECSERQFTAGVGTAVYKGPATSYLEPRSLMPASAESLLSKHALRVAPTPWSSSFLNHVPSYRVKATGGEGAESGWSNIVQEREVGGIGSTIRRLKK